jgi:hypothetical protein
MKKRVLFLLLSVSVWVPMLAVGAQAQYAVKILKVNVPFEFHVQGKPLPAGTYTVRREGGFLSLRDQDARTLTVLTANTLIRQTASDQSKLVFYHSHGLHLLTQIFWEGDKTGVELIGKGREEAVARRIGPTKVESAAVDNRP